MSACLEYMPGVSAPTCRVRPPPVLTTGSTQDATAQADSDSDSSSSGFWLPDSSDDEDWLDDSDDSLEGNADGRTARS